jgi:membrane protein implicated in regulation of membrane protease activity
MSILTGAVTAVFNFLVGDLRILIGTIVALAVAAILAGVSPAWAGLLLFAMLAITLALALRRELEP